MAATEQGVWNLQEVRDKALQDEWTYEAMEPGPLWAIGGNPNGQLGLNDTTNRSSPKQVGTESTWDRVAGCFSGYGQEFAGHKSDGTLWAWGRGTGGQLGDNSEVSKSSPVQIPGSTWSGNFSVGTSVMIATKTDGTLWAWGSNNRGQLGQNQPDSKSVSSPVQIGTDTDWSVTQLESVNGGNSYAACACMKTDGTLWAWGSNADGQLGQNDRTQRSSPVQIPGTWTGSKLSKPYRAFTVVKSDGTLWSWGGNARGNLGLNDDDQRVSSPTQVGSDTDWKKTVSGNYGTIALKTTGELWYFGSNEGGAAGQNQPVGPNGQRNSRSSPVQITSGTDWDDIAVSMWSRYANKTDGTLYGWGRADGGALYNGNNNGKSSPTQLNGTGWIGTLSACYGRALLNVRSS